MIKMQSPGVEPGLFIFKLMEEIISVLFREELCA